MLDHTSRRIADAMARLHDVGQRSIARLRLSLPVVGSRPDFDEHGLAILRPIRVDEFEQERVATLQRFAESMRRLSRSPVVAEPVDVPVAVPFAATCKMVPDDAEIGAELCE